MERLLLCVFYLSGWSIFSTCRLHRYHYVNASQTWTEAQTYCREKHTDLVTIRNMEDIEHIVSSSASSKGQVWIGLYSVIDWKWSDGYRQSGAGYYNWDSYEPDFYSDNEFCGSITSDGRWWDDLCTLKYPFICYNGTQLDPEFVLVNQTMSWSDAQQYCRKNFIDLATVRNDTMSQEVGNLLNEWTWMAPVKKHLVKLRMKLEDSSVDLNDPALQDRVQEQGVSGATLKWREQPDGKVFHKEGKEEKKTKRKKTEL
ncbi:hypothetical protein PAMP_015469 [Pampus punctatissimus]